MSVASEVVSLSALELRELYRAGSLSPVEVAEATLARIEHVEPRLNAFVTPTPERALEDARHAEVALRRGEAGPLCGIPYSIKDVTPTKGIRTARGSLVWKDWVPDFDGPAAERSAAAGGILLGKTTTPELGWKGDSGNRVNGPAHNPWRHGLTPGGSSGGAAAAVAAGAGPVAQGTDGAGSVRIPAAFCGVFGLKPSFGLVPYYPPSAVWALSHVGPITRTVRDAALYLGVLAGPDARDQASLGPTGVDYLAACEGGIAGLRVAWSPALGGRGAQPDVAPLVESAARAFAELGAAVEEASPDVGDPLDLVDTIWSTAMAAALARELDEKRDLLEPGLVAVAEEGRRRSGVEVAAAYRARLDYTEAVTRFMERYDLLLTPTLPYTAFPAGDDHPAGTSLLGWTPFTYPFNITGQPAATVPCGLTADGLPAGLQIVGRWHDDATVLRAAAAFEEARPWPRPPL